MPSPRNTSRSIAIVVSAVGICSACGIGDNYNAPPPPPPPVANISLSAMHLDLGATRVGDISPAQQIVITNHGSDPLRVLRIYPAHDVEFEIDPRSCTAKRPIPALGSCTLAIAFHPRKPGRYRDQIVLDFETYGYQSIDVAGQAIARK